MSAEALVLPAEPPRVTETRGSNLSPAIREVVIHMERHFNEPLTLDGLAAICRLSMHRFATVFRRQMGIPPHQYLCRLRVRHAYALLRDGVTPAEAALEAGFCDQSHLSRHFRKQLGVSPGRVAAAFRPVVAS
ncbi:helix-turn-helix transcriptional regulator [Acetobacteraceae bacterium H6797]|nr:helix-turn-helix transcriptional regulator [Acetobacteraceae bacterium H6797]